jgi:hypothetical protein
MEPTVAAKGAKGPKGPKGPKPVKVPVPVVASIPWLMLPGCVDLLLSLAMMNGNHLSSNTKLWTKTQDAFFKQPMMLPYVEKCKPKVCEGCNELESVRKIKERFNTTIIEILDDVENGRNQSGKYGERTKIYDMVEQIVKERARKKQEKDDDAALKKELDLSELELLAGENEDKDSDSEDEEGEDGVDPEGGKKECRDVRKWGPEGKYVKPPTGTGKRKLLTGQIVGNPLKSQRVPTLTLEDRLMNRLDAPKKKQRAEEEEAEEKMLKYVDNVKDHNIVGVEAIVARCYNSQRQLTAEQSADRRDLFSCLSEVGMTVMISIYCSRGAQFGAAYVKTELKDIGVLKLDCHKIYTWLQELRSAACAEDVSSSMASSFAAPEKTTETTVLVHEINSQEASRHTPRCPWTRDSTLALTS